MGKLANAIGEPVTANHSVDEVVEGLGEMLSTFKTNMMNSGVMVESSDKFKQLIDKIKGLTEGEGNNKGIQFAEGNLNTNVNYDSIGTYNCNINYNIDFNPTYIFLCCSNMHVTWSNQTTEILSNVQNTTVTSISTSSGDKHYADISLTNITNTSCDIQIVTSTKDSAFYPNIDFKVVKYYAIGVGEEDTTLRDSLASILQEEGVNITEEDDMASLIAKVDEEFDTNKQELINALIDKGVKNIDNTLSLTEIISKIQNFDSYTEPVLYLYDNGNDFTDNTGGFTFNRTSGHGGSGVANEDHLYVHVYAYPPDSGNSIGSAYCETTNFINITNYKSLYVNLDYNYSRSSGSMGAGSFYIDLIDESGNTLKTVASETYSHVGYEGKIDITNYAGNVKIRFRTTVTAITTRSDSKLKVYHARLEKAELPTEE
jgi:hypothetical protein